MTSTSYRNETALVNAIIASIQKKYGGFALKIHGGLYQRTGIPDILYWLNGKSYAFEVKTGYHGYKATELQKIKLEKLAQEGVHVGIVYSVEEVHNIIESTE